MKILLTGAAGMLANDVCRMLSLNKYILIKTDINQRECDIQLLDVRKLDDVMSFVESCAPDFIFHFAAETDVDLCEQKPDHAFITNTLGTENMALAALRFNIPMLYISTGNVFDGKKPEPYTEFDQPNPISVYGKSKYEGEKIICNLLNRYFIIRAGWMIGGWKLDNKFVFKIMIQLEEGKKELTAVNDKFGSPTFTFDFANNLLSVIFRGRFGLYHMTNVGMASRFQIACEVVRILKLEDSVKVNPVNSAHFPLPAPRVRSEAMINYKLNLLGLNGMPEWEKSLKKYIETYLEGTSEDGKK
jgi:dTDP-4-dehydrorhamnose reductase